MHSTTVSIGVTVNAAQTANVQNQIADLHVSMLPVDTPKLMR